MAEEGGQLIDVPVAQWQEGMSERFKYEVSDGVIDISAYADEKCVSPLAAVAYFEGDLLAGIDIYRDFEGGYLEKSSKIPSKADRAKIMLWDNMMPLSTARAAASNSLVTLAAQTLAGL